jgi:hypothetical protein
MPTRITNTRRAVVGLVCIAFMASGSAAAYWAGIPDEQEIQ